MDHAGTCKDMIERNFFAHVSPVPGKKEPRGRANPPGACSSAIGERGFSPKSVTFRVIDTLFLLRYHIIVS